MAQRRRGERRRQTKAAIHRASSSPPRGPLRAGVRALVRAGMALLAGVALVALALALHHWATTSPVLAVRAVRFEGLSRAARADLMRLADLAPGKNVLALDTGAAERAMVEHPWVVEAEVTRHLDRTVRVRVAERRPRALVALGHLYFVDTAGDLFRRAVPGDDADLPLITGLSREEVRPGHPPPALLEALRLLDAWSVAKLDERAPISELHADPLLGFTVSARALGSVQIGRSPFEEKLARLTRLSDALAVRKVTAASIYLDDPARPERVAVRLGDRNASREQQL